MAAYYTINMYPVQFKVDYPDRPLDRVSTLFRVFFAIPIWVVLAALSGSVLIFGLGQMMMVLVYASAFQSISIALMLLFRNKYPRWWFDWNLALAQFTNRVAAYMFLLTDEYPSTDEEQSVHLDIAYPDTEWGLNRVMPLFKWLFAFPHYVVLFFLWIAMIFVSIAAWFAILFTGRYPRPLFDFVVGVMRWGNRVAAYAFMLVTDTYPPFRLHDEV
ncbi:MAG: DUF4389 domain-containing protein [SAR202 cluster bacterium]|jgi:hypothetical protein|nr:DUF4389 domain-containing protein [SAR202 cluster bacterium]MDP6514693.1 DUF4389 domain-containing protein [SAR202 cluster bacterium]MDP6715871.1 DUF4389 domain-containing protein [SAR202 cluster bacterium]